MAQSLIEINGVAAANEDLPINTLVQLSNADTGGEITYLWEVVDQPPGTADTLSNANIENPTITPKKEGTYLFRLTVNQSTVTEKISTSVVGIRHLKSRRRQPAAKETTETSLLVGWARRLNEQLDTLERVNADPGIVVGQLGTPGVAVGKILRMEGQATLKTGLPGQEEIPVWVLTDALTAPHINTLIGVLLSGVDGGSTPGVGTLVRIRVFGLSEFTKAGVTAVGTAVFVNDTGDISLVAGTVSRRVGRVMSVSGGVNYRYSFSGLDPGA